MVASLHRPVPSVSSTEHTAPGADDVFVVDLQPTGIDAVDSFAGATVRLVERGVDSDLNPYVVVRSCRDGASTLLYDAILEPLLPA